MKNIFILICLYVCSLFHSSALATTPIISASQNSNGIAMTWGETDVTLSGTVSLEKYQISYNEVGGTPILIDNISKSLRSYTIPNLTFGKSYEVRIIEVIRVVIADSNPFTPPFIDSFIPSPSQTVTLVFSNTPPIARCKNLNLPLPSTGQLILNASAFDNGSSDNENDALTYSLSSNGPFGLGFHSLTLTVQETTTIQKYTATCTATLQVTDQSGPEIFTRPATVYLNMGGYGTLDPKALDYGTRDNTGFYSLSLDKTLFTCEDVGSTNVTLTATDANGNSNSKVVSVSVVDNTVPYIKLEKLTLYTDETGKVIVNQALLDSLVYDACGIKQIVAKQDTFSIQQPSDSLNIIATDEHGNVAAKRIHITLKDTLAPSMPSMIMVYVDTLGNAQLKPEMLTQLITDPSGIDSTSIDKNTFSCIDAKDQVVQVYAKDKAGNIANKQVLVSIMDTLGPTILLDSIVVTFNQDGEAAVDIDSLGNIATDNCGVQNISFSPSSFTLADTVLTTIQLTISDANGNSATKALPISFENSSSKARIAQQTPLFTYGPNPAESYLNVHILTDPSEASSFEIMNEKGQIISKQRFVSMHKTIDLSHFKKGTYYLKVNIDKISEVKKIEIRK